VRRAGFTLLEMMAVALLTAIVFAAAVDFYIDLSTASRAAIERVRSDRRAVALVDRVARDLESAVLVTRPSDVADPLAHPWVFRAEGEGELGAEQLLFVSRGRLPRASALRESDLEMVAYWLEDDSDGQRALLRWSLPHLPESLLTRLPAADEPGADVLAEGVAAFGVRLLDAQGAWVTSWDSSQLVESGELPLAAEISVALLPEDEEGNLREPEPAGEEPLLRVATRRVLLPLRPRDLERERDPEGQSADEGEDDGDDADGDGVPDDEQAEAGECMTVAQCLARNPGALEGAPAPVQEQIRAFAGECYRDVAGALGGLPLVGCQ
jgi:prepilin-type N-terminal cleavage/methylation domain-containing protein